MSDTYSVVFAGELVEGFQLESVQKSFTEMFKINQKNVQKYFSGQPRVIKKEVDHKTAAKYKKVLEKVGASVELRKVSTTIDSVAAAKNIPLKSSGSVKTAPLKRANKENKKAESSSVQAEKKKEKENISRLQSAIQKEPVNGTKVRVKRNSRTTAKKMLNQMNSNHLVGTNAIESGRLKQEYKLSKIAIADEPRSMGLMFTGIACIAFAIADFGLNYYTSMMLTGVSWSPIISAVFGVLLVKSSSAH